MDCFQRFAGSSQSDQHAFKPSAGPITGDELNSAMSELLTVYNLANNPNYAQKADQAFVSMDYDSIVSRLRLGSD